MRDQITSNRDGIPDEIVTNKFSLAKPYLGDHEIRYDPIHPLFFLYFQHVLAAACHLSGRHTFVRVISHQIHTGEKKQAIYNLFALLAGQTARRAIGKSRKSAARSTAQNPDLVSVRE